MAGQESGARVSYHALTHIGRIKKSNQDRVLARRLDSGGHLFAVIDGLGGQPGGGEAADTVVSVLTEYIPASPEPDLSALLLAANRAIIERGDREPELCNMGAAVTVMTVEGYRARWAHVGDCRLYHVRGRSVRLVTEDQNLAWELFARREISEEQRRTHRFTRFLSQCLGEDGVEPAGGILSLAPGDRLVLCTDGIHDLLPGPRLETLLTRPGSARDLGCSLSTAALEAGGLDNIGLVAVIIG